MSIQAQAYFVYELELLEPYQYQALWTEREQAIQKEHLAYLDSLTQSGTLELAGITDQGLADHLGLVILRVDDYETAKTIALADPSVKKGMMKTRIRPMNIYFRRPNE